MRHHIEGGILDSDFLRGSPYAGNMGNLIWVSLLDEDPAAVGSDSSIVVRGAAT